MAGVPRELRVRINRREPKGQTRVEGEMAIGLFLWLMDGKERQEDVEEEGGARKESSISARLARSRYRLAMTGCPVGTVWHRLARII
jgi:hypothetical protein